jgi:hypothetical protein
MASHVTTEFVISIRPGKDDPPEQRIGPYNVSLHVDGPFDPEAMRAAVESVSKGGMIAALAEAVSPWTGNKHPDPKWEDLVKEDEQDARAWTEHAAGMAERWTEAARELAEAIEEAEGEQAGENLPIVLVHLDAARARCAWWTLRRLALREEDAREERAREPQGDPRLGGHEPYQYLRWNGSPDDPRWLVFADVGTARKGAWFSDSHTLDLSRHATLTIEEARDLVLYTWDRLGLTGPQPLPTAAEECEAIETDRALDEEDPPRVSDCDGPADPEPSKG